MAAIVTFFMLCFLIAMDASAAEYEVREGENLTVISRKTGVSVSEIRRANNLDDDRVDMGQKLYIPGADEAASPRASRVEAAGAIRQAGVRRALPVTVPKAPGSGNQTSVPSPLYTVTDGDTLTGIARRYNTTVDYLRQLNNLSDTNIRVGQKLRLRPEAPGLDGAGGGPTAGTTGTGGSSPRHVVRSGDTLSSLARQYGVKLSQLREWNELESDTIRVGQKLRVGQGRAVAEPGPANRREVARNDGAAEVHVVQSGETLFSISRQYAVSVPDLRVANELRSDSIFAGQKLRIPGDDFDPAEALATRQSDGGAVGTGTLGGVDAAEDDGWISPTSRPMQEPVTDQQTSTGAPAAWEQPGHYLDLVNPGDAGATAQAHLSEANQTARPAPTGAGTGTYMVQPNDTLWGISRKFDVSLERLRAINDLRGDTIRPGKTLRIP